MAVFTSTGRRTKRVRRIIRLALIASEKKNRRTGINSCVDKKPMASAVDGRLIAYFS